MLKIVILCVVASCALASYIPYHPYRPIKVVKEPVNEPRPYEFSYDITDEDGNSQGRTESGDAHGNMKGSYTIRGADGFNRKVEYVADGNGFRPVIFTNEPGTDAQNPADVVVNIEEAPVKVVKIVKPAPVKYKLIKVPIHHGPYGY